MSLEVDEVKAGCEADGLPLPLAQILHRGHGVKHLVADHLGPQGHGLPPNLRQGILCDDNVRRVALGLNINITTRENYAPWVELKWSQWKVLTHY